MLAWKRDGDQSELFSVDVGDRLLIWDLRPISRQPLLVLSGLDRVLYQACDAACDVRQLMQIAGDAGLTAASINGISERLQPLVDQGILLRDGSRYLGLAISLGEYSPHPSTVRRFYRIASGLGRRCADRLLIPLNGGSRLVHTQRRRRRLRTKRIQSIGRRRRLTQAHFAITDNGDLEIRMLSATLTHN